MFPREGVHILCQTFRGSLVHEATTMLAAARPQIEDVVCALEHIEVVLDDHDGVPLLEQGVEGFKEFGHVVDVQSGRRFVKNEEGVTLSVPPGEEGGELDALCLAAAERVGSLTEGDVSKADVLEDKGQLSRVLAAQPIRKKEPTWAFLGTLLSHLFVRLVSFRVR